ncbi:MAG: hypothetical protein K2X46_11050, partial [Roseomonas sp.]|nr:hypothetical protein [Roseomonas sp.]
LGRFADGRIGAVVIAARSPAVLPYPYVYSAGTGQATDENIAALVGLRYPADDYLLADVKTAVTTV